jgi:hypothetical protein
MEVHDLFVPTDIARRKPTYAQDLGESFGFELRF